MIIDARDTILGRLCSYAAKKSLLGEKIYIVNCEESVVTGKKMNILNNYLKKSKRKAPTKAPYFYKRPDFFVKRTIRGMLPFKRARGRDAFKNIKCFIGTPENFKGEKIQSVENSGVDKLKSVGYLKIREICKSVGWKPS